MRGSRLCGRFVAGEHDHVLNHIPAPRANVAPNVAALAFGPRPSDTSPISADYVHDVTCTLQYTANWHIDGIRAGAITTVQTIFSSLL